MSFDGTTNEASSATETEIPTNSDVVPTARTGSFIAGIVLILMGTLFLINEFLPDFNFGRYWPVLLVVGGVALLFTAFKKDKS